MRHDPDRLSALARLARPLPRPAALVDLDAFEHNVDTLLGALGAGDKTLRIASKSVRHRGLLRRAQARGGARVRGLMCYHAAEAAWLAGADASPPFDDLLVAYPTVQPAALDAMAGAVRQGATIRIVVDDEAHLEALDAAGRRAGCTLEALVDVDVSYRPGARVHLGVRRSPIRGPETARALAEAARRRAHVRLVGAMAYEAHIASLADDGPGARVFKRLARPAARRLRQAVIDSLTTAGVPSIVVNGGGTGSVPWTASEPRLTEVTAGSGLLCSTLFDQFDGLPLRPALFIALEVCRLPDAGHLTCGGGGIIASGAPGADRLPRPVWPPGLSYLSMEGAGEVQTPFARGRQTPSVAIGDSVLLRPSKAGEPASRFTRYHLLRGEQIVAVEPTYRGEGQGFL